MKSIPKDEQRRGLSRTAALTVIKNKFHTHIFYVEKKWSQEFSSYGNILIFRTYSHHLSLKLIFKRVNTAAVPKRIKM